MTKSERKKVERRKVDVLEEEVMEKKGGVRGKGTGTDESGVFNRENKGYWPRRKT